MATYSIQSEHLIGREKIGWKWYWWYDIKFWKNMHQVYLNWVISISVQHFLLKTCFGQPRLQAWKNSTSDFKKCLKAFYFCQKRHVESYDMTHINVGSSNLGRTLHIGVGQNIQQLSPTQFWQHCRFLTSSVKIIIFDVLGEMSGYTVSLLLQVLFKLKHDGEWLMSDYDPMANFKFQHSTMSLIFVKRSANYDAIISR